MDRILTGISSTPAEKRELLIDVEVAARQFVREHWSDILRLANALYARGRLDEAQIRRVLSRASSIALNPSGADSRTIW
jgi:hypothetical protein